MEGFCGEREFYCALHDAVFNGKAKARQKRFGERGGGDLENLLMEIMKKIDVYIIMFNSLFRTQF